MKHSDRAYESYSPPEKHVYCPSVNYTPIRSRPVSYYENDRSQHTFSNRDQAQIDEITYQDARLSPVNFQYNKDSFLNSRSTLKLIAGLKEWVSCWMLGMSKRKKRISVNNRKTTIASVMFSQTSQSLTKTGERLSSSGEYSTKVESTLHKKEDRREISAGNISKNKNPITTEKAVVQNIRHKKGPAPLPPTKPTKNHEITNNRKSMPQASKLTAHSVVSLPTEENSLNSVRRKNQKKRRAPLPPNLNTATNNREIIRSLSFKLKKKQTEEQLPEIEIRVVSGKDEDVHHTEMKKQANYANESRRETSYNKLLRSTQYIDETSDSDSGNEVTKPVYEFSLDDSDVEVTNGITMYSNHVTDNKQESIVDTNEVFKAGDMRLQISIAKTEMNVLTFEHIEQSDVEDSAKEDDVSSLSDFSEDLNDTRENSKYQKDKSSSSENSPEPLAKPIFDELKLKSPSKASVKDIVQAFNMLAAREKRGNPTQKIEKEHGNERKHSNEHKTNGQDIRSFPTKWQYQKNGAYLNFPPNSLLLPIVEEDSYNELSDHEAKMARLKHKHLLSVAEHRLAKAKGISMQNNERKYEREEITPRKFDGALRSDLKKLLSSEHSKTPYSNQGHASQKHKNEKPIDVTDVAVQLLTNGNIAKDHSVLKDCHGTKAKNLSYGKSSSTSEQPIVVSLYIEDKSSHKGPIPFIVYPSMTLRKLKKKIEMEYNFDKDVQCWILGETFAIHDKAPLSSYGVSESGCPILLYVMSADANMHSLPNKLKLKSRRNSIYDDVAQSTSESDGENVENVLDRQIGRSLKSSKQPTTSLKKDPAPKYLPKPPKVATSLPKLKKKGSHFSPKIHKKKDYHALVELDNVDLVNSIEAFECPVCFTDILPGDGVILQECLHSFCRECLASSVEFSDTAMIKCPFRNDEYSCESHLQEREIKSLVSPEIFERHLQRSMALAESQAKNSFHCKSPDCMGWCLYEDNVNTFLCPVCKHTNCLTCAAIHEGKNCRQYQDEVSVMCDSSEEAKKTKEYLENMVKDGDAMKCPQCAVILMKKWGCDWLKCSMCHTEVCWVTKGPRWGPSGRGDTSGGCKCMLNGVRCHPKCNYCH